MRDELGIYDGLVFRGEWLFVLQGLRTGIKRELHASHAGMDGCLRRARKSVYWPSMNSELRLRHYVSPSHPLKFPMAKRHS